MRPTLPNAIRIFGQIGRGITDGERMHPNQRRAVRVVRILKAEPGEIRPGGGRKVGRDMPVIRFVSVRGLLQDAAKFAVAILFLHLDFWRPSQTHGEIVRMTAQKIVVAQQRRVKKWNAFRTGGACGTAH